MNPDRGFFRGLHIRTALLPLLALMFIAACGDDSESNIPTYGNPDAGQDAECTENCDNPDTGDTDSGDECTLSCENGGTCEGSGTTSTCDCPSGFTGELCETEVDPCDSDPCQNGGSCAPAGDSFACTCAEGFAGHVITKNI